MRRWGFSNMSMACLAVGFAAAICVAPDVAEAHPTRRELPMPQAPAPRPHLVIVEDNRGFVIRCETPRGFQEPQFPRGAVPLGASPSRAIPLGTSIRIDRAALQPSNQKDIDHGQIR